MEQAAVIGFLIAILMVAVGVLVNEVYSDKTSAQNAGGDGLVYDPESVYDATLKYRQQQIERLITFLVQQFNVKQDNCKLCCTPYDTSVLSVIMPGSSILDIEINWNARKIVLNYCFALDTIYTKRKCFKFKANLLPFGEMCSFIHKCQKAAKNNEIKAEDALAELLRLAVENKEEVKLDDDVVSLLIDGLKNADLRGNTTYTRALYLLLSYICQQNESDNNDGGGSFK